MSIHTSEENKSPKPRIPDACPVCKVLLRSLDLKVYERIGVCADCEMHFVQLNSDAWNEGWRPDSTQVSDRLTKRREEPFFYRNEKYI